MCMQELRASISAPEWQMLTALFAMPDELPVLRRRSSIQPEHPRAVTGNRSSPAQQGVSPDVPPDLSLDAAAEEEIPERTSAHASTDLSLEEPPATASAAETPGQDNDDMSLRVPAAPASPASAAAAADGETSLQTPPTNTSAHQQDELDKPEHISNVTGGSSSPEQQGVAPAMPPNVPTKQSSEPSSARASIDIPLEEQSATAALAESPGQENHDASPREPAAPVSPKTASAAGEEMPLHTSADGHQQDEPGLVGAVTGSDSLVAEHGVSLEQSPDMNSDSASKEASMPMSAQSSTHLSVEETPAPAEEAETPSPEASDISLRKPAAPAIPATAAASATSEDTPQQSSPSNASAHVQHKDTAWLRSELLNIDAAAAARIDSLIEQFEVGTTTATSRHNSTVTEYTSKVSLMSTLSDRINEYSQMVSKVYRLVGHQPKKM